MTRTRTSAITVVLALVAVFAQSGVVVGTHDQNRFIWPTVGRITQPFGCTGFSWEPRYGDCKHFHGGIDIANARGTSIRAAGAGMISHVGWDPWGTRNWMVILKHGNGLVTWYAHMRPKHIAGIREGARVRQGQLIGYMSDTGHATGVHLHWAVLLNGAYKDPRHYVDGSPRTRDSGEQASPGAGCTNAVVAYDGGATAAVLYNNDPGSAPSTCTA